MKTIILHAFGVWLIFAGLYSVEYVMDGSFSISWIQVSILFGISALLLAVTAYLTGRLSKERIVTTIA